MARIILDTPGSGPHSGQPPALAQQAQSRGARGRGRRRRRISDRPRERRRRGREEGEGEEDPQPISPTRRSCSWQRAGHPASAAGAIVTEEQELEGGRRWRRKRRRDPMGGPSRGQMRGGDATPPEKKRIPPGIHRRTCAPVVVGSLWRLPASQRRVAPRRGDKNRATGCRYPPGEAP